MISFEKIFKIIAQKIMMQIMSVHSFCSFVARTSGGFHSFLIKAFPSFSKFPNWKVKNYGISIQKAAGSFLNATQIDFIALSEFNPFVTSFQTKVKV